MIDSESSLEAKFTLETERGGVIEDPPFRMLVLGDWSGRADKKDFPDRRPIEIDRDNFDEVIERLGTRLVLDEGNSGSISLQFQSLDDFHPDRIFQQLPMFERLRNLRRDLLSPDKFNEAASEVRSWFNVEALAESSETPVGTAEQSEGLLDAILSGSTAPASAVKRSGDPDVAALIKDLVRPHLVSVDENEQTALIAAVDAATSDLMIRILHDHRFQSLEAAWRGLYLLVRSVETSTELKIFILDVSKDEISEDLRSVTNLDDSKLFKLAVSETIDTPGAEPWTVLAGNYAFVSDKNDIATLMRLGKIAAAANAPFISHMRPDVIGVTSLSKHPDPAEWDFSDSGEAGKLWTILRATPEAQYLGMTIPRFLSRLPYGRETEPLETFQFEEFPAGPRHDSYVWSNGCFVAALLIAQTFTAYGWQMDQRFIQDIERLPMHTYELDGETVFQPCAEILFTQSGCEQLMEYGLMPLVSYKNTDHVKLARFQSISDPITGLRGHWYV